MEETKPLVWLRGEIKTPPFSPAARREAGFLLRLLQSGEKLSLPQSRHVPTLGSACHELRVDDRDVTWRVVYAVEEDAIVILEVFAKKTGKMPASVLAACQSRLRRYRAT